jgi:hypothetical protein
MARVDRLTLVAQLACDLSDQCLAQLDLTQGLLQRGFNAPVAGSPLAVDLRAANSDDLRAKAHGHVFEHVAAQTFGMQECAGAIGALMAAEVIRVSPTITLARSLVEHAASAAWILDPEADTDHRSARGLAALLRVFEAGASHPTSPQDESNYAADARRQRDDLIAELEEGGATLLRASNGTTRTVTLGRATVSTHYRITTRIKENLDLDVGYGDLSAFAHGDSVALMASDRSPAELLSLVPTVMFRAIRDWSGVVQTYVGTRISPAFNQTTLDLLRFVMTEMAQPET